MDSPMVMIHRMLRRCLQMTVGAARRTLGRNRRLRRHRHHVIGGDKIFGVQTLRAQKTIAKREPPLRTSNWASGFAGIPNRVCQAGPIEIWLDVPERADCDVRRSDHRLAYGE